MLEQLRLARHRQFGKSSERAANDQIRLDLVFNEAEVEAQPEAEEPTLETVTYQSTLVFAGISNVSRSDFGKMKR
nr:transposase [Alicyclobacillus hesperidum]